MIPQPARRPNQNLWLMLQALDLTANISSTIDDLNLGPLVFSQPIQLFLRLDRQFTRWRNDQGLNCRILRINVLKNRQPKRSRLPGPGLCLTNYVIAV